MELQDRWNKLLKIQEELDQVILQIKSDLEKNRIIREEWYSQKNETLKNYKNLFTLENYKNKM
jgi:hypothetical protein